MRDMTREDLSGAFAGESQAHMKYKAFADVAEREKLPNVARLFRAASYAEQMHATNHLRALGGIGKTSDNLAAAFAGETFEINEMYPAYMAVAELQGREEGPRQHARRPGGREDPCGALCRGPGRRRRGHGHQRRAGLGVRDLRLHRRGRGAREVPGLRRGPHQVQTVLGRDGHGRLTASTARSARPSDGRVSHQTGFRAGDAVICAKTRLDYSLPENSP